MRHLRPLSVLLLCSPVASCSSDATTADSTTGRRVAVHVDVAPASDASDSFVLASGHTVKLTRAALALDAVQLFDGAPAVAAAPRGRRGWRSWLVGTAHAHPGHYQAGNALGEVLVPGSFDLLRGAAPLGDGEGVTGTLRSGRVAISAAPTGAAASALAGAAAAVEGSATKGGVTLHFRLFATRSELDKSLRDGRVEGCPFTEHEATGDLSVTLTVRPQTWLSFVDFGAASGGTEAAPVSLGPESPQGVAFAVGVAQLAAFRFTATP